MLRNLADVCDAVVAVLLVTAVMVGRAPSVEGHGRLLVPPSRSSVWRLPEFSGVALINNNDHELNCGGLGVGRSNIYTMRAFKI